MLVLFRRWGKGIFAISYCQRVLYWMDVWSDLVKICLLLWKNKSKPCALLWKKWCWHLCSRGDSGLWSLPLWKHVPAERENMKNSCLSPGLPPELSTWALRSPSLERSPKTKAPLWIWAVLASQKSCILFTPEQEPFTQKYGKVCICQCWFLCGSNLVGTFCNCYDKLCLCYILSKCGCTFAHHVLISRQIIFAKCFWIPLHGSCMNRRDGFLLLGVNKYLAGIPVLH